MLTSSRVFPATWLRRVSSRFLRLGAGCLLTIGLVLTATACGMNVQTLNPYTPADGVNFDAGSVRVRNVLVLTRAKGDGFLSGTLVGSGSDTLQSISGTAMKADGSEGSPLTVTLPGPVALTNGAQVVLTDQTLTTVKGADLEEGLTVRLVFTFAQAGEVSTTAPVLSASSPEYATISPSPSPAP